MNTSWNEVSNKQYDSIPEYTPITYNDKVVGHTIGENKINSPVRCILYPFFLDILQTTDMITSMEIRTGDECNE